MNHPFKVKPAFAFATAFAAGVVAACSSGGDPATSSDVGTVDLALEVGASAVLDTVDYVITGPASYSKNGSIDVSGSSTLSARVSGIPQGAGYSVALTAVTRGGGTTCAGSAPFDVTANQTTPVDVRMTCTEAARTGSILVNGTINICPTVGGIAGAPLELLLGTAIQLLPVARDLDHAPLSLAYNWTATNGTLTDPSAEKPFFACSALGPASLTLTVFDGDISPGCAGMAHAFIDCIVPVPDAGGSPP